MGTDDLLAREDSGADDHPHTHDHDHSHDHRHDHFHGGRGGHGHGLVHESIKRSREGLRSVGLALLVLTATAVLQLLVFVASGSVALLADLIHNFGDAATAIPLALAGAVGYAGNWWAAIIRTRAGRRLNSPALVADGAHARADAYVSLAVVASAAAVAIGADIADPLIGLGITLVILKITLDSWRTVRAEPVSARA